MQSEDRKMKNTADLAALDPAARVKQLAQYGTMVEVDPNVPPRRYFRSGLEMVRMANVYLAEGNLENAYILFMKFMTLFVEKIRKHPEYGTVPAQVKAVNQAKLKEVMPKAEKLKQKLLDQYAKERLEYEKNAEKRQKAEEERRKQVQEDAKLAERLQADENKLDHNTTKPHLLNANEWAISPSAPPMDGVVYPDDFAPPRHSAPLIPPHRPPPSPPSHHHEQSPGMLGSTLGMRTVVIPGGLLARFAALAAPNTARNIELCGILTGVLERDRLKITHVIVPKQTGTADSCVTTNEEEIFHYQDQHNLITLGWIHTHPTQTAFLSSVDLHTQCAYQLMMPEAVAIVQAPKYNETGYFALTTEGMSYISNCRLSGFHPHPEDPLLFYTATHIHIDDKAPVEMVDLRR